MPPVLSLPIELLYYVSKCLDNHADLSSWSRSCRAFHAALTPLLYRDAASDPAVMCWACDEGRLDIVQRLLDAGANANVAWSQHEPRWWTLKDLYKANRLPPQRRLEGVDEHEGVEKEEKGEGEGLTPSLQLDGDLPLSQEMRRYHRYTSNWLARHTTIDHRMTEYFGEKSFHVDDADRWTGWHLGFNDLGADEDDVESRPPWAFRYHPNLYKRAKTFPQLCYWTPLHIAASWGNDKLVGLLLDHGADIKLPHAIFARVLLHLPTAGLLLSRGASTNVTTRYRGSDERRFTALHSACVLDLVDIARALVDGGHQTDVMVHDHSDFTPFAYAFFRGNWAMIDFLLEHGTDLNVKIGPLSALGHACLLGYYAEALRLLDLGATPQCELEIYGRSPIYFHLLAVAGAPTFPSSRSFQQRGFRLELVDRLIKHGVDVNQRSIDGTTALMGAATFHRVGVVKALLRSGANLRIENRMSTLEHAVSPYMWSDIRAESLYMCSSHRTSKGAMLKTVRVVLEAMAGTPASKTTGIDVVKLDIDRFSTADRVDISNAFLTICSSFGEHDDMLGVAALLLRYTKAAGMANTKSDLVYDAIKGTNFDIADLLLENGFDPPRKEQFEDIIQSFITEDIYLGLRYLINRFPEFSSSIRSGQLLCEAVDNCSEGCVAFLIGEGVSVDSRNEDGSSLLFSACVIGDTHTAEVLLRNGADPDEYTADGVFLTTIAAREDHTGMVECLLDYGASIHSSPPNKPTPHGKLGFLDIAITLGLLDIVTAIIHHKNYGSPTDEEVSRHWQTIINAPLTETDLCNVIDTLLDTDKFDANQVYTTGDDKLVTTPLHTCAAIGVFTDKTSLIDQLISYGADIHRPLLVTPGSQNHCPELGSRAKVRFEGTTPLEWAIEFSSIRVVRALISQDISICGPFLSLDTDLDRGTEQDLMVSYAKALCRRQKPEMFSLLFKDGLDPNIIDGDGNTMIHMICDYVETFWPNDEPEWKMESIAERAAYSLIACLKWNVPSQQKNKSGVSGVARILEIVRYSGDCEFHQTLAERWRERIEYVDGPQPKFVAKFPAIDDAGRDEALLDPEELFDELDDDSDDDSDDNSDDDTDDYLDGLFGT